nr:reverse transcriptase/maturase family protein [Sporosarcina newyorkensis]
MLVQRVIYKAINEQIETEFSEYQNISFAYRKGRSAPEAAQLIYKYTLSGYTTVLDADIEGFFDNISHKITMIKVGKAISEEQNPILYSYIRRFISVDRVKWEDYKKNYKKFHNVKPKRTVRQKGIPQGGVLSGLIANLFLHDFDKWVINDLGKELDLKYIRYADDFVVLMRNSDSIEVVKQLIKERLDGIELTLHSNPKKTKIIDLAMKGSYVNFVGFSISPKGIRIKHSNIVRFKNKLSEMVNKTSLSEGQKK